MINIADVMSFLLSRCVVGLPASSLADVFDRLIWCMDDNGREIEIVRREWLFSNNKKEVEVALYMSETFPFNSKADYESCFNRIAILWPDLKPRCIEILDAWEKI